MIIMNQNCRAIYDEEINKRKIVMSERPLKYMTTQYTDNRILLESSPENIDISNNLRVKPTRLNNYNRPECEIYGTAPYKLNGSSPFVDIESELRNGNFESNDMNRILTESTFDNNDSISDDLQVDFRPRSTRVDLRNSYCNNVK